MNKITKKRCALMAALLFGGVFISLNLYGWHIANRLPPFQTHRDLTEEDYLGECGQTAKALVEELDGHFQRVELSREQIFKQGKSDPQTLKNYLIHEVAFHATQMSIQDLRHESGLERVFAGWQLHPCARFESPLDDWMTGHELLDAPVVPFVGYYRSLDYVDYYKNEYCRPRLEYAKHLTKAANQLERRFRNTLHLNSTTSNDVAMWEGYTCHASFWERIWDLGTYSSVGDAVFIYEVVELRNMNYGFSVDLCETRWSSDYIDNLHHEANKWAELHKKVTKSSTELQLSDHEKWKLKRLLENLREREFNATVSALATQSYCNPQ